jgi:hypothetical protein
MGFAESVTLLTAVCLLFLGFLTIQVVAAHGFGAETLATRGITVAAYARSGYFQLLAVVLLTSVVLVSVDALRGGRRHTHPVERGLFGLIVMLTLAIEWVAMQRLVLYIDAFGLTMLRFACVAAAVWMTVLLVLIAASALGAKPEARWLPSGIAAAFVVTTLCFIAINPEAQVAHYNVHRAGQTPVDIDYLASLSDDAVPELVDSLNALSPAQAMRLRVDLCRRPTQSSSWAGWNLSQAQASDRLITLCEPSATAPIVIVQSVA